MRSDRIAAKIGSSLWWACACMLLRHSSTTCPWHAAHPSTSSRSKEVSVSIADGVAEDAVEGGRAWAFGDAATPAPVSVAPGSEQAPSPKARSPKPRRRDALETNRRRWLPPATLHVRPSIQPARSVVITWPLTVGLPCGPIDRIPRSSIPVLNAWIVPAALFQRVDHARPESPSRRAATPPNHNAQCNSLQRVATPAATSSADEKHQRDAPTGSTHLAIRSDSLSNRKGPFDLK